VLNPSNKPIIATSSKSRLGMDLLRACVLHALCEPVPDEFSNRQIDVLGDLPLESRATSTDLDTFADYYNDEDEESNSASDQIDSRLDSKSRTTKDELADVWSPDSKKPKPQVIKVIKRQKKPYIVNPRLVSRYWRSHKEKRTVERM